MAYSNHFNSPVHRRTYTYSSVQPQNSLSNPINLYSLSKPVNQQTTNFNSPGNSSSSDGFDSSGIAGAALATKTAIGFASAMGPVGWFALGVVAVGIAIAVASED